MTNIFEIINDKLKDQKISDEPGLKEVGVNGKSLKATEQGLPITAIDIAVFASTVLPAEHELLKEAKQKEPGTNTIQAVINFLLSRK